MDFSSRNYLSCPSVKNTCICGVFKDPFLTLYLCLFLLSPVRCFTWSIMDKSEHPSCEQYGEYSNYLLTHVCGTKPWTSLPACSVILAQAGLLTGVKKFNVILQCCLTVMGTLVMAGCCWRSFSHAYLLFYSFPLSLPWCFSLLDFSLAGTLCLC